MRIEIIGEETELSPVTLPAGLPRNLQLGDSPNQLNEETKKID